MAAEPPPPASPEAVEGLYRGLFDDDPLAYSDAETLALFVEDLAARKGGGAGAALLGNFAGFLAPGRSPDEVWRSLLPLARMVRQAGHDDLLAAHAARAVGDRFDRFAAAVEAAGRPTVVFVAHRPYFVILRESMYLRRRGFATFLVSLEALTAAQTAVFARHFDAVVDARMSRRLLRGLLTRLAPDVFHVQCWMWSYYLGRLVIESRGRARVVCEFYDITSIYAPRDVLAGNWPAGMVDLDLAMERLVVRGADAIVHRFPPAIAAHWLARHGADAPAIEMQPYPCAEYVHHGEAPPPATDGRVRLVYAGQAIPATAAHSPALFPERTMPGAFERLLAQGFAIDILYDPVKRMDEERDAYGPYFDLAERFPDFRIVRGVPPDELSPRLAAYDFGILLFEYDPAVARLGPEQMAGIMSTKIFAYLEAGLPILVNAEYRAMGEFVAGNGFGLAVATADLPRLSEMVAGFDREAARARIRRYSDEHGMQHEIVRLIGLYARIGVPVAGA